MTQEIKHLTYEQIENLSYEDLKKEKIECQLAIINTKELIKNLEDESDIGGANYDRLCRKLAHLKRLMCKMDLRLAEFNSIRSVANINAENTLAYNNYISRLEVVQLLKPESKYALFHQVCHDFLDIDTCKMLTHETMRRLTMLKTEAKEKQTALK